MGCGQGMVEVCAVKRISCTFVVKIPLPVLPLDMWKRPSERGWGKRGLVVQSDCGLSMCSLAWWISRRNVPI